MTDSLGSAFGLLGQSIVLGATIRVVDSSLSSFGKKRIFLIWGGKIAKRIRKSIYLAERKERGILEFNEWQNIK